MTCKRYLPPFAIETFLASLDSNCRTVLGTSVANRPIESIRIGSGPYKVLMWSQMHGNETTTTKALMDFIPWFLAHSQKAYREAFSLFIIMQLNPDGAHSYTRENTNGIDLNRDALDLSQPESQLLRSAYDAFQPDLCLNLHGQRTLYSAGLGGPSASLSFLAPAADQTRKITPARAQAMQLIATIAAAFAEDLPGAIGRYDDTFNPNCVGDTFTQLGTPTILFEAGHTPNDYQREQTRSYIFKSYRTLFKALLNQTQVSPIENYSALPQNCIEFYDCILENIMIQDQGVLKNGQKLGLSFREVLKDNAIQFQPEMKAYGNTLDFRAHHYLTVPEELQSNTVYFENDNLIKDKALLNFLFRKIKIN